MSLLSLIGKLALNTNDFESGLKRAESASDKFANNITGKVGAALAGAFSIAAVSAMISKINDSAIEVEHLAKQYELTTDEVQLLQKATGRLGLEFGNVAGAIGRIQKARAQALGGGEKGDQALGIFRALGVSESTVLNPMKSVVDVMKEIVAGSNSINRSVESNKAEFELLGKNAIQLKSIMGELASMGPAKLIDSDNINSAIEAMKEQKRAMKELEIASAPAAGASSRFFTGAFGEATEWAKNKSAPWWTFPLVPIMSLFQGAQWARHGGDLKSDPDPGGVLFSRADQFARNRRARAQAQELGFNSFQEVAQIQAIQGMATKAGSGSLANVGGYFFGDQANQSLLSEAKRTTYLLEEIKEKTNKIADNFNPEAP